MTDFMTALHLILVQLRCPEDQRLVRSLSRCGTGRTDLQMLSNKIFVIFYQPHVCITLRKSDAMLYAPSVDEIKNNCENMSLKCYMLELIMVLDEEEIEDQATKCIISFNEFLQPPNVSSDGCPACETYSLKNTSTFLDRLKTLLEKMNAQRNM
uniref:Interleukin n=1 Tax=Anabas testudineus TaxID=64144 RepID=A0AAQ6IGE0_ANATE